MSRPLSPYFYFRLRILCVSLILFLLNFQLFMLCVHAFHLIVFILYFSQLRVSLVIICLRLTAFFYIIPHRLVSLILVCLWLFPFISPVLCILITFPSASWFAMFPIFFLPRLICPLPISGVWIPFLYISLPSYFLSHADDDSS